MQYKFFTNSFDSWRAINKEMQNAKLSIYVEMYIVDGVIKDFDFIEIFIKKAKEGLKIKLILDSFGSKKFDLGFLKKLKENNVEVLFVSYLFHRLHKKIIIIDEKIAFLGGVNLYNKTRKWKDISLMIGGVLVPRVLKAFVRSYKNAQGKDLEILNKVELPFTEKLNNWVIDHVPYLNKAKFKFIYKNSIDKAENTILLNTPYLVPRRWLVRTLHQACLRGVLVEIIVPKNTDHGFLLDRINYFYINKLSRLGVKIYLDNKMNHAKALLVDDKEAIVGSQNLDFLSFHLNSEIGVFFNDKNNINKLKTILEKWKKEAVLFEFKRFKIKRIDYILNPILAFFYRVF